MMNTRKEILDFLASNKTEFKKEFKIIRIGVFGSYARNENKNNSDIDLIVEFEPNTEMLYEKKRC